MITVLIDENIFSKDKTNALKFILQKTRGKINHIIISTKNKEEASLSLKEKFKVSRKKHYAHIKTVNEDTYWDNVNTLMKKYKSPIFLNTAKDEFLKGVGRYITYSSFFLTIKNRKK